MINYPFYAYNKLSKIILFFKWSNIFKKGGIYMTKSEILLKREQLECLVVELDKYLCSLNEEEVKKSKEYAVMKKAILDLNTINSALLNCVFY